MMNVTVRMIHIGLMLFLLAAGCSKEEQSPPPGHKPKVVRAIPKPAPKKVETAQVPERAEAPPVMKPETPKPPDTPPAAPKESAAGPRAAVPAEAQAVDEKGAGEKKQAEPEVSPAPKDEAGFHVVKKGETLRQIARMDSVYGDPLKWVMVYRFNLDALGNLTAGDDFPTQALPEGLKLKILTPKEIRANLKKRPKNFWVVNVLSSMEDKEIVPAALTLIQKGYPAYITTANVKGKDWMRLRIGFFKTRKEADAKGAAIRSMLNAADSWSTKAGEREIENFGGF